VRRLFCLIAAAFLATNAPAQNNVYRSTPAPAPSERDDARPPAPAPSPPAQNLPDLGDSSQADMSPQDERRIGESIMREIRRDPDYVDDPEIRDYVQSIGHRLVAASGETRQEFEFFVVRDKTVNAFAMPGGFVGIHTGLLLAAQTESEFASVLGHEIAHVLQRHMARQYDAQSKISKVSLLGMLLGLLAARSNSQVAQAAIVAGQAAPAAVFLSYSRDFEREADRVGYQLLDGAGFDTAGMPGFFERLQKATRLYENNAPTYLRTHPLTTERIADMQNRQAAAPYRQRPDSTEFQLVRAKLRAADGTPQEAEAFFRTALAEKRFANEAAVHYGYAAAAARAKDWKTAETEIAAARKLSSPQPMFETLAARIKADSGDPAGAEKILAAARATFPDSVSIKLEHAEMLQRLGRNKEAVALLEDLAKGRSREPRIYQMLAKSYAALGQRTQQHRALAEGYLLQGSLPAAIEQLQFAQAASDTDFYTLSAIDARLRELKAQQAQAMKERRQW
jgi:beta-barrel assembly-enhancing protease